MHIAIQIQTNMSTQTSARLLDPLEPLGVLPHRKLEILRLARDPPQTLILTCHLVPHGRRELLESLGHLVRLVQVLVELILELVVRRGRFDLVLGPSILARLRLSGEGNAGGRAAIVGSSGRTEPLASVGNVGDGLVAIGTLVEVTLVDLVFLRLAFALLRCQLSARGELETDLVPDHHGSENALVELFELGRLVLGTQVIGFGHVEVALRVGDAF
jgi:hypothetical protein